MSIPKPDKETKEFFDSVIPDDQRVKVRPMFGNFAAFVNGNMFMGILGNDVFIRLPDPDRKELLVEKEASIPEPLKGRPMREYVTLPNSWRDEHGKTADWVNRSINWVGTMPVKKKKEKRKDR